MNQLDRSKLRLFAGLCLACFGLTGGYAWRTARHAGDRPGAALPPVTAAVSTVAAVAPAAITAPPAVEPFVSRPATSPSPVPPVEAAPTPAPSPAGPAPAFLVRHT